MQAKGLIRPRYGPFISGGFQVHEGGGEGREECVFSCLLYKAHAEPP